MNCKQGDMARVVPIQQHDEWARGFIVRCVKPFHGREEPAWYIEPELRTPDGLVVDGMYDCILRPIRGDGVTDDEVRELYAPKQPEVVS